MHKSPFLQNTHSAIPAGCRFGEGRYAFGSGMKERTVNFGSNYRYGFNNQEKDAEMGDYYAFEYRIHDARIGRFLSVDPLAPEYPWNSTYAFAENRVIWCIELEGLEGKKTSELSNYPSATAPCDYENYIENGVNYTYSLSDQLWMEVKTIATVNLTAPKTIPGCAKNVMTGGQINIGTQSDLENLSTNDLSLWQDLIDFENSNEYKSVYDEADRGRILGKQSLDEANGDKFNNDYHAIHISQLPIGFNSAEEFLLFFRMRLLGPFLENTGNVSEFRNYSDRTSNKLWNSLNPLGSIMVFESFTILGFDLDDAPVLTTQSSSNNWIFTPVETFWDNDHPLAGHRDFGIQINPCGGFTLYTRGIDMLWGTEDVIFGDWFKTPAFFNGAKDMWNSVMKQTVESINLNGGHARVTHNYARQISWNDCCDD